MKLDNSKVYGITGDVNEEMVQKFYKIYAKSHGHDLPIVIFFSTDGGCVVSALGIYDLLEKIRDRVTIIVVGNCYSAGTIILQGAGKRYMTKNSSILVHYGFETNTSETQAEHNQDLNKRWKTILRAKTKIHDADKWFQLETYFNADQSVYNNLVDEIYE